jgi:antitoxin YefM
MNTVTATKARSTLAALIQEANASHEPIQITSKGGNAVLVSEADWRAIQETLHLQAIPGMVDSIQQAQRDGIARGSRSLNW